MKKIISTLLILVLTSGFIFAESPKREMRAVWIATVNNLDWPSSGNRVPPATGNNETQRQNMINAQKNQMIAQFDRLYAANFNAVFFQVRTMADALYRSSFEPWSNWVSTEFGADPGWDPLAFAIEQAHKRGMELHAWLNPYRYSNSIATFDAKRNYANTYSKTHPHWILDFGRNGTTNVHHRILNPALPEVTQRIIDVVDEIIRNYNVDGIVFDDYFYISRGETSLTADQYNALDRALWQANPRGLSQADWRRDNVNRMIKAVFNHIQYVNPAITFGVSPAAVSASDPAVAALFGVRPSPTGQDWQRDAIFACPLAWLQGGFVDFVSAQAYVTINSPTQTGTDYSLLIPWWSQVANRFERHFYSSQFTWCDPGNGRFQWCMHGNCSHTICSTENSDQIRINREADINDAPGSVYFSMRHLTPAFMSCVGTNEFRRRALTPAISWKPAPLQPMVENLALNGNVLSWTHSNNNVRFAVYAAPIAQANDPQVFSSSRYFLNIAYTRQFTLPAGVSAATHRIAVAVIDGFGNRYAPRVLGESLVTPAATTLIYPATNTVLVQPTVFTWQPVAGADSYVFQIARDAAFTDIVSSRETTAAQFDSQVLTSLRDGTRYYWRVRTLVINGGDAWSEARSFTATILARVEDVSASEDTNGNVIQRFPKSIAFTHRMNRNSVQQAISFEPAANVTFSWANDWTLRVNISSLSYETDYKMTINGSIARCSENNNLIDGAGNQTAGSNFVFNFRTIGKDSEPPIIVSYDPQGNQEVSARPIVRIEFDKPLNPASLAGKIVVRDRDGNAVAGVQSYQQTANFKSVMHFIFNQDLVPQETYTVTLLAGVEDTYGNAIPEDFVFTFTARPRETTLVTIIDDMNAMGGGWTQPGFSGTTIGIDRTVTNVSTNTEVVPTVESTGSIRMNYLWEATAATPNIRWHNTLVTPNFSRDNTIQYYLFGDGSNTRVAVVLRVGGAGQTWAHQLVTLDWVGWRKITWNMATDPVGSNALSAITGTSAMLPTGNVLNLSCFQVEPAPVAERLEQVSSIYFSRLRVVRLGNYLTNIGEVPDESGINLFATNSYIHASALEPIHTIRIYSLLGALVKSVHPEQLSVQIPTTNLAQGVYVVKVETDTAQKNVRVIVQ